MCRVANHYTRLPSATSSLALNASSDGGRSSDVLAQRCPSTGGRGAAGDEGQATLVKEHYGLMEKHEPGRGGGGGSLKKH